MLKHALVSFLLPPGLFVWISAVLGASLLRNRSRAGGIALLLFGASLWAFSIGPVSDPLVRRLESPYENFANPKGDVIVLFGGGTYEHAADLTGEGAPNGEMTGRLLTAVRLQKRLSVPILVSGGHAFRGKPPEAPIVKRFLVDLGVPEDRILLEEKSRDTRENAMFSARILRREGFEKPILVTSAFHMKRAALLFERAGVNVVPAPAAFRTWNGIRYGWEDYLPSAAALLQFTVVMKEYLGLIYYGLFP